MLPDLIFDIGLHRGFDTEFYLAKGYRVVAVDANPYLCAAARQRFASEIAAKRLTVLNYGIAEQSGPREFIINRLFDDWSSFMPELGARTPPNCDTPETERVPVRCVRLDELLAEFGCPYYLKVDIEGYDEFCVAAIERAAELPRYFSVEATPARFAPRMLAKGYRRFKIISQVWNTLLSPPLPSREGRYAPTRFTIHHSGPFGAETYGEWLSLEDFEDELAKIEAHDWEHSRHKRWGCPADAFGASTWHDYHCDLGA